MKNIQRVRKQSAKVRRLLTPTIKQTTKPVRVVRLPKVDAATARALWKFYDPAKPYNNDCAAIIVRM